MEVLLYHSAPWHVRSHMLDKTVCHTLKQSSIKNHQVLCSLSSSCRFSGFSIRNRSLVNKSSTQEVLGSIYAKHYRRVCPTRASNESGYVMGGEESLEGIANNVETTQRIMIPGLPDESNGESSAFINSCFWEWKPKFTVHYEKAGCENVRSPPILFLPGFGAGSFHYEKQLRDLGRDYRVWALDFLGQGKSMPSEDPAPSSKEKSLSDQEDCMWGLGDQPEPWAKDLVYSVDMWMDQVHCFIEQVIGEPVYVVGNSLGGYVALYFAASNPHLVKGITLLNATPFWGFLPNAKSSPVLARMFPWAGTYPPPANVRKFMNIMWQKLSDPETIADLLRQVYADHTVNVDKVFSQIVGITQHPAAAASFASIMCAPTGQLSFGESLSRCRESNIPICLLYGKEDPWVKPIMGKLVKWQLPEAPYYQISPAGHCPHDEVPEVVNYLLRGWIKNLESQGFVTLPLLDDGAAVQYDLTKDMEFLRDGSKKSVAVRFFGSQFSFWIQLWSQIRAQFQNLAIKSQ